MVWVVEPDLDALNALHQGTAVANLGIEMTEVGADFLQGRMPVDARTMQPFGLLHGGASVLLLLLTFALFYVFDRGVGRHADA